MGHKRQSYFLARSLCHLLTLNVDQIHVMWELNSTYNESNFSLVKILHQYGSVPGATYGSLLSMCFSQLSSYSFYNVQHIEYTQAVNVSFLTNASMARWMWELCVLRQALCVRRVEDRQANYPAVAVWAWSLSRRVTGCWTNPGWAHTTGDIEVLFALLSCHRNPGWNGKVRHHVHLICFKGSQGHVNTT